MGRVGISRLDAVGQRARLPQLLLVALLFGDELHVFKFGSSIAGLIDDTTTFKVTDLVTDKRSALTRLYVLKFHDCVVLVVNLKAHAISEICRTNGCHVYLFLLVCREKCLDCPSKTRAIGYMHGAF